METTYLLFLAAIIAASLQIFLISAPLNPGVRVASLFAYYLMSILLSRMMGFRCTSNIYRLPYRSGRSISIILSNLPGLVRAGSRTDF
jgi:hypothetical protein